ncbi:MAG TPA: adenylate/guanylate cyclase domain-containing protein [Vulgatibacter sp.]
MKTATYTVMFTDIVDFTERTSRQTRAQNARLLRLHDSLLLPVIRGYLGRRVKSIGDSYLVVFDSASRALACAAAIQDRLAAYNARVEPGDRLEVRIALSAGEVRVEGGDVFGEPVNLASRVEGIAKAGEVCFSESVYLLADRESFAIESMGFRDLKGIPESVGIFRLRRREGGAVAPYGGVALAPLGLPPPTLDTLMGFRLPSPRAALAAFAAFLALAAGYLLVSWKGR